MCIWAPGPQREEQRDLLNLKGWSLKGASGRPPFSLCTFFAPATVCGLESNSPPHPPPPFSQETMLYCLGPKCVIFLPGGQKSKETKVLELCCKENNSSEKDWSHIFRLDTVVGEMSEGKTFLFTFFLNLPKFFAALDSGWHLYHPSQWGLLQAFHSAARNCTQTSVQRLESKWILLILPRGDSLWIISTESNAWYQKWTVES